MVSAVCSHEDLTVNWATDASLGHGQLSPLSSFIYHAAALDRGVNDEEAEMPLKPPTCQFRSCKIRLEEPLPRQEIMLRTLSHIRSKRFSRIFWRFQKRKTARGQKKATMKVPLTVSKYIEDLRWLLAAMSKGCHRLFELKVRNSTFVLLIRVEQLI